MSTKHAFFFEGSLVFGWPIHSIHNEVVASSAANFWGSTFVTGTDRGADEAIAGSAVRYWTGSLANGTSAASHCQDWTSSASGDNAVAGESVQTDGDYIGAASNTITCDSSAYLLCISQ